MIEAFDSKLSQKTHHFLAEGPHKSFVGGRWITSSNGQTIKGFDPGTGEQISESYVMQASDVDRAVKAAEEAFHSSGWATMSPEKRRVYIARLVELCYRDAKVLGELEVLDFGTLISASLSYVTRSADRYLQYADMAANLRYNAPIAHPNYEAREVLLPYGVCAGIHPWNGAFASIAIGTAPALVTGNTVIVKPAGNTPLTTLYLARLVEEADFPPGVFNVVIGTADPTGHALAKHPRIRRLSLTGSVDAGKYIASECGKNLVPVKLELGGKGAAVLFDDIDVENTAQKLTTAITWHAGQICSDCTRWLVHDKIYDDFVSAVTAKMEAVKVGYQFDPETEMGPMINSAQCDRVLSYVKRGVDEGASLLTGGNLAEVPEYPGGAYMQPTLLAGSLDNVAAREEIFGPVAYIARFSNEAEAIEMVNNTPYGLANSVWSTDLDRCNRVAEQMVAGCSWINAHNILPSGIRFGGIFGSGMGGGVNCESTVRDYLRVLSIARPL